MQDLQVTWTILLAMAVMVYTSTEVIKGVINVYFPQVKIGLLMALILGILFDLGLGIGVIGGIFKVEYTKTFIPYLTMGVDILTTGAILSMGSKGINMIMEKMGLDLAGSIEAKLKVDEKKSQK